MELSTLALIAFALSIDSYAAGISYGVRKIKLPLTSLTIISLMSMLAIAVSMLLGYFLVGHFSPALARRLGGIILIAMGLWVLVQSLKGNAGDDDPAKEDPLVYIRIKALGLAIQILKEPSRADLDRSGIISPKEAVFLGLALAMDAFGAGIALSLLGFNAFFAVILVGISQFIMIKGGMITGHHLETTGLGKKICHLPGAILITLGLFKIY